MTNLLKMVRDISFQFAKYHYDKYLDDNKIKRIENNHIEQVVDDMWSPLKKKELAQLIRAILKDKLKEEYSPFQTETIINEMFEDELVTKQRIITEIELHQQ